MGTPMRLFRLPLAACTSPGASGLEQRGGRDARRGLARRAGDRRSTRRGPPSARQRRAWARARSPSASSVDATRTTATPRRRGDLVTLDDGDRAPLAARRREVSVAVERLAAERDEELARRVSARVSVETPDDLAACAPDRRARRRSRERCRVERELGAVLGDRRRHSAPSPRAARRSSSARRASTRSSNASVRRADDLVGLVALAGDEHDVAGRRARARRARWPARDRARPRSARRALEARARSASAIARGSSLRGLSLVTMATSARAPDGLAHQRALVRDRDRRRSRRRR